LNDQVDRRVDLLLGIVQRQLFRRSNKSGNPMQRSLCAAGMNRRQPAVMTGIIASSNVLTSEPRTSPRMIRWSVPERGFHKVSKDTSSFLMFMLIRFAKEISEQINAGTQFVCVPGQGGSGKTTGLQEIHSDLPSGSCMIVYDCDGAGHFLDANAYRHRKQDAFLQLSNGLSPAAQSVPVVTARWAYIPFPSPWAGLLSIRNSVD
jgi:hypothetical protein